jgi:hypothetical protein
MNAVSCEKLVARVGVPTDRATWRTRAIVTRVKVSSSIRGLDVKASMMRIADWTKTRLDGASVERMLALRFVCSALMKVARREAYAVDYARAHNAMLDWVCSLPKEGGGPRPFPQDAANIAQVPPRAAIKLHDVFAGLVEVLHTGGFTYQECGELLDDGWGGRPEQRTRRARQQASVARRTGRGFLHKTLEECVKGECRVCAGARIALAGEELCVEGSWSREVSDGSRRDAASGGGGARDAHERSNRSVVDPHGQTASVQARQAPADPSQRARGAALSEGSQRAANPAGPSASHRSKRSRSETGRGRVASTRTLKR